MLLIDSLKINNNNYLKEQKFKNIWRILYNSKFREVFKISFMNPKSNNSKGTFDITYICKN